MDLKDGYLIILPREQAKTFFGHRENEPRLAFLHEVLAEPDTQLLCFDARWKGLHEAFSAVDLKDSVLAQCILGGRPMHRGDDYHICLVRPDIAGFIAQQGSEIEALDLPAEWQELATATIDLYRQAAEVGGAMVFVAKA